jgi:hypothetical protein
MYRKPHPVALVTYSTLVVEIVAGAEKDGTACACRKSDSAILVMKAAEDRL